MKNWLTFFVFVHLIGEQTNLFVLKKDNFIDWEIFN